MFHKPKDILKKSNYTRSREVYEMMQNAYQKEVAEEDEFGDNNILKARMVEGNYKVKILESMEHRFFFEEDKFFVPSAREVDDVRLRKNAQNCLKILFDYTNLQYKDIFKLLTDDYSCQLWINDLTIKPEKHAIKLACLALGLDKIFASGKFGKIKQKINKLIHMEKSYDQKATIFSSLVERNKDLQKEIFSRLKTKPCKYSDKFDTRYDAKIAEKMAEKSVSSPTPL